MQTKLPIYHGTIEKSHLWELRMQAALGRKDLIEALEERMIDKKTSEKARSIIIPALGDSTLRSIQDCDTSKAACDKFQHR